jgi:DNA mismatch repair protein MutH
MLVSPPRTEADLLDRARAIAGLTVAELAAQMGVAVPPDLRSHKGWLGELVEQALGANAASLSEPDFVELGIELKTLPIDAQGRVVESTYVCTVPLQDTGQRWQDSCVYRKLRHVLWVPVETGEALPLAERRIGMPLLWRADPGTLGQLHADWEELMEMVCLGRLDELSARHGEWLQIRPKAANARVLGDTSDAQGQPARTLPRGFYLRTVFTNRLLAAHYTARN